MITMDIKTDSKTYPLYLGHDLFTEGQVWPDAVIGRFSKALIVTDEHVAPLYLERVKDYLSQWLETESCVVPGGEQAKAFDVFYEVQTKALEASLDRKSCIVALGGGAVGDLAGFVAATYMRGIGFIQMPTTLLAHDSSVGGKTAINHPLGKNMIGAFYQPDAVIYDVSTLKTLPDKEWRSGVAEVIKHALIYKPSFFEALDDELTTFQDLKALDLVQMLKQAIAVKQAIVAEDEKEAGIRSYLNFGHTLGHAIEAEMGYGAMTHGEAVAIGMIFAMRLSEQLYHISLPVERVERLCDRLNMNTTIPDGLSVEALISRMKQDKKSHAGTIRMVLMKAIGSVETRTVDEAMIREALQHK